ncbi:hypothetical protein DEM26_07680 [Thioclava sp. NG1]|uniref:hypothetical protein n=1 Tax=Thioclava sp. NG1 TaxID=2182426 RepID=UPI000D61B276|nr:hypothetical protein [Thioclava sp. NG1]PWE50767.1 hypothetical protein DEM26_07680 [Thioclava sp. NG1]
MTLTIIPIEHRKLCHGWAWAVDDEDVLAERVARIVLGQYRHVAKILSGAGVPGPVANAEQARAAIRQLTLADGEDPWHRDGWMFQAISWIAAHQRPSASLTRMPHIRKAEKGFDGMQLELDEDGTEVIAVVIFEDKATDRPRDTIRDDVWPGIAALERGERLNELSQEVSGMLDARAAAVPEFDIDTAIANTIWKDARRYRVSITIGDTHNNENARARLFSGFDGAAVGAVERRRADTIYLPAMRDWMNGFAERVIEKIEAVANV